MLGLYPAFFLGPENARRPVRQFAEQSMVEFVSTIPYDKKVTEAQIEKLSVVEYGNSPAAENIRGMWEKIRQE